MSGCIWLEGQTSLLVLVYQIVIIFIAAAFDLELAGQTNVSLVHACIQYSACRKCV